MTSKPVNKAMEITTIVGFICIAVMLLFMAALPVVWALKSARADGFRGQASPEWRDPSIERIEALEAEVEALREQVKELKGEEPSQAR